MLLEVNVTHCPGCTYFSISNSFTRAVEVKASEGDTQNTFSLSGVTAPEFTMELNTNTAQTTENILGQLLSADCITLSA